MNKQIVPAARESVKSCLLFFLYYNSTNTIQSHRLRSHAVDVTPPQAATKIMAGMAAWQKEWQNWRNGRIGYICTIYGTHNDTDTNDTDTDDTDTLIFFNI